MSNAIFVGTASGLWQLRDDLLEPVEPFTARTLTAMARGTGETWALVDGGVLWRRTGTDWTQHVALGDRPATCVAVTSDGVLVGTEEAHLIRVAGDSPQTVDSFETVEGRDAWHTPWGDPADVRSIAVGLDGTIYVNVHVGGVVRSRDGGRSWTPTVDIEADVHQVVAHPRHRDVVMVAAYDGFGISRDAGDTWEFITCGMHAHYARALAVAGDTVLVSASTGPRGRRSTPRRTSCAPRTACPGSTTTSTRAAWPPRGRSRCSARATAACSARMTRGSTGAWSRRVCRRSRQ